MELNCVRPAADTPSGFSSAAAWLYAVCELSSQIIGPEDDLGLKQVQIIDTTADIPGQSTCASIRVNSEAADSGDKPCDVSIAFGRINTEDGPSRSGLQHVRADPA
jgi:hypothetical protein